MIPFSTSSSLMYAAKLQLFSKTQCHDPTSIKHGTCFYFMVSFNTGFTSTRI